MVPTVRGGLVDQVTRCVGGRSELEFFDPDQLAQDLHAHGLTTVHSRQRGLFPWIVASKAE